MVSRFSLTFKDVNVPQDKLEIAPTSSNELEFYAREGDGGSTVLYFNAETIREIRDVLDFWLKEVDDA